MQMLATTAQMKELDRIAIQERGIPSLELMERAAHEVARAVVELVGPAKGPKGRIGTACSVAVLRAEEGRPLTPEEQRELDAVRAVVESRSDDPTQQIGVLCGPGNNGGDGIAAARLLLEAGYRVRAFLVGDRAKLTRDSQAMEEKLAVAGGKLEPLDLGDRVTTAWLSTCDCLIDALFGVGLKRPLEGDFLAAVRWMNGHGTPVVACDLPSGVDGDTGAVLGEAVRARATVTFTCAKPGLYLGAGAGCAGKVRVADIGIPWELVHQLIDRGLDPVEVAPAYMKWVLPRRPVDGHKGDFGKLFILAGSEGYTGAPALAARGALRAGAGLVFLGVPREIYPILAVKCDEAMPFPLPERYEEILEKARACDVAVIGPGLGRHPRAERLVRSLLADLEIPVVLDADGINALAGHIDSLDRRPALTVLTPHEGEFARLTGCTLPIRDRVAAARAFAREHRCVLVLKGHGTVTAGPDGHVWINGTGNPGMAKGGSGDVLAGVIAALLGQKHLQGPYITPAETVALAVWLHGGAGDRCAGRLGEYAMLPTDLIEALPEVLRENAADR